MEVWGVRICFFSRAGNEADGERFVVRVRHVCLSAVVNACGH